MIPAAKTTTKAAASPSCCLPFGIFVIIDAPHITQRLVYAVHSTHCDWINVLCLLRYLFLLLFFSTVQCIFLFVCSDHFMLSLFRPIISSLKYQSGQWFYNVALPFVSLSIILSRSRFLITFTFSACKVCSVV